MNKILASFCLAGAVGAAQARATAQVQDVQDVQDAIFLGDDHPIFLRLRILLGDRPFRDAWADSVAKLHEFLDRDGDGKVTRAEADRGALSTLVRLANGTQTAMPRTDLDNHPKDGVVSIEELGDALATALGPFRVEVGRIASTKADALFEQLDADKDGILTGPELAAAETSLSGLDLDDDELIDPSELEPFANPMARNGDEVPGRRARLAPVPPVIEYFREDPTLRPVRLLLKKYDKGSDDRASSQGDNKLSLDEFAIAPEAFAGADVDGDAALNVEELRRFLVAAKPDVELVVNLSADASGTAKAMVQGPDGAPGALPPGVRVERIGDADLEIAIGEIRLDVHVDDGARAVEDAKAAFLVQFDAADTDKNGYLERDELNKDKDHPSSLLPLFDLLDRDEDGKIYPKEMEDFIASQAEAARSRMVLSTSDQGRAIFAILDLDRDRRLGIRELRETVARVTSWDRDKDAKVGADEIPHHYQLTLGRSRLAGLNAAEPVLVMSETVPAPAGPAGPNWFVRMDRNRDGDVSPREFLGSRDQFQRLDCDRDGLIDADEARAASTESRTSPSADVAGSGSK